MNAVFGLDQDKSSYYLNVKVLWLAFEMFSTLYMCFWKIYLNVPEISNWHHKQYPLLILLCFDC